MQRLHRGAASPENTAGRPPKSDPVFIVVGRTRSRGPEGFSTSWRVHLHGVPGSGQKSEKKAALFFLVIVGRRCAIPAVQVPQIPVEVVP